MIASLAIGGGVQAQNFTEVKSVSELPRILSGKYTADGKPLLVAYSDRGTYENPTEGGGH